MKLQYATTITTTCVEFLDKSTGGSFRVIHTIDEVRNQLKEDNATISYYGYDKNNPSRGWVFIDAERTNLFLLTQAIAASKLLSLAKIKGL